MRHGLTLPYEGKLLESFELGVGIIRCSIASKFQHTHRTMSGPEKIADIPVVNGRIDLSCLNIRNR